MNINNDNKNQNYKANLAMAALSDIPTPNKDAQKIVALVKHSGSVVGYKLSDGKVLSKQEGVSLARQGGIFGVGIAHRGHTEYLKSLPDEKDENNLSSLPSVSQ